MIVLLLILGITLFPSEQMQEFGRHSNGSNAYVFISAQECDSGLKSSGYAYTPKDHIVLKQVNLDGTVDLPACQ
jgi:hypothetical protein